MNEKLHIHESPIRVKQVQGHDFICITDMVKAERNEAKPADVVSSWFRSPDTSELLEAWKKNFNSDFKVGLSNDFKMYVFDNHKRLSAKKYIEMVDPFGVFSNAGRYVARKRVLAKTVADHTDILNQKYLPE